MFWFDTDALLLNVCYNDVPNGTTEIEEGPFRSNEYNVQMSRNQNEQNWSGPIANGALTPRKLLRLPSANDKFKLGSPKTNLTVTIP